MVKDIYIPIEKFSLRYKYYVYFDVVPYVADHLFIDRKVRVWYDAEYTSPNRDYNTIFCHVLKKDVPAFLDALEELKQRAVVCGHPNYVTDVQEFIEQIRNVPLAT